MSVEVDKPLSRSEIIKRFDQRIRNYVTDRTDDVRTTPVMNTTVGSVTSNQARLNPDQGDLNLSGVSETVRSNLNDSQTLIRALRNMMVIHARNHLVRYQNTGNLGGSRDGVCALDRTHGTDSGVVSDFNNAVNNLNLTADSEISAGQLDSLITQCRSIWNNRCRSISPAHQYNHNWCHSNFSQYAAHGSRGRR